MPFTTTISTTTKLTMALPLLKLVPSPFSSPLINQQQKQPLLSLPISAPLLLCRAKRTSLNAIANFKNEQQGLKEGEENVQQEELDARFSTEKQRLLEVAGRWREIQGSDDWAGLLDPMDPVLRWELIRYGEMAQACYDSFIYDPFSTYCGCCKYPDPTQFFSGLGMPDSGYDVTRYLYATSNIALPNFHKKSSWKDRAWSERANWIGYVAVSTDEATAKLGRRDIVVAWRGTVTKLEWIHDLMNLMKPVSGTGIPCPDPAVKVESGFVDLYVDKDPSCRFCKYSAREQILTEIRKLLLQYTEKGDAPVSITVTGHSLGAALAALSAYDIAETGLNVRANSGEAIPITVFSFAGPRVGDTKFKERFEGLGIKALRVVNVHDTVPKVPGVFLNEHVPGIVRKFAADYYSHVGVELSLDHTKSPFLKDSKDPADYHNLEAHLHLLDGHHGKGMKFMLASGRDPALVNKSSDFLKEHHMIPPCWKQDENKGMIRTPDGRWTQPERPRIDDHPSDTHYHLEQLGLVQDHPSVP